MEDPSHQVTRIFHVVRAIPGSELVVVQDAPHGFNVSHADEFNRALLDFLAR